MSRRCPICGKGPLRRLKWKKHVRNKHSETFWSMFVKGGKGYLESRKRKSVD